MNNELPFILTVLFGLLGVLCFYIFLFKNKLVNSTLFTVKHMCELKSDLYEIEIIDRIIIQSLGFMFNNSKMLSEIDQASKIFMAISYASENLLLRGIRLNENEISNKIKAHLGILESNMALQFFDINPKNEEVDEDDQKFN